MDMEVELGYDRLYSTGYIEEFQEIMALESGYIPVYRWTQDLEVELQLMREDVESHLDEAGRFCFAEWRREEERWEEVCLYRAFLCGVRYERANPRLWNH